MADYPKGYPQSKPIIVTSSSGREFAFSYRGFAKHVQIIDFDKIVHIMIFKDEGGIEVVYDRDRDGKNWDGVSGEMQSIEIPQHLVVA
tara:strand:+ start:201 stop:464 length:264 start_codon:yes stop_codon:yes gene_type:complete